MCSGCEIHLLGCHLSRCILWDNTYRTGKQNNRQREKGYLLLKRHTHLTQIMITVSVLYLIHYKWHIWQHKAAATTAVAHWWKIEVAFSYRFSKSLNIYRKCVDVKTTGNNIENIEVNQKWVSRAFIRCMCVWVCVSVPSGKYNRLHIIKIIFNGAEHFI